MKNTIYLFRRQLLFQFIITVNLLLTIPASSNLNTIIEAHASKHASFILIGWSISIIAILSWLWIITFKTIQNWSSLEFNLEDDNSDKINSLWEKGIFFLMYSTLIFLYFYINNPSTFGKLIFHGDFPYQYYVTYRNIDFFHNGVLQGWDRNFLGGYPTFLDFSKDLSPLVLPLTLFFSRVLSFNLSVMLLFIFLPIAFMFWIASFSGLKSNAYFGTSLFILLMIANVRTFCNGMVAALAGMLLFFLISGLWARRNAPQSSYFLIIAIVGLLLQLHIHTSFFLFTLFFLIAHLYYFRQFYRFERKIVLFFLVISLGILPYLFQQIQNIGYSVSTSKGLEEGFFYGMRIFLFHSINILHAINWGSNGIVLIVLLSYIFFKNNDIEETFFWKITTIFFLLNVFKTTSIIGFALSRSDYILAPLICILIVSMFKKSNFAWQISIYAAFSLLLIATFLPFPKPLSHISINEFQDLRKIIITQDNERILAENAAHWNAATLGKRSEKALLPHYVPYLQLALGKPFMSNPGADPYHYSIYRFNTITSGTFYGKHLKQVNIKKFIDYLKKWRIKFLIVWSKEAISVLKQHKDFFVFRGEFHRLNIFYYKGNLEPTVMIQGKSKGSGTLKWKSSIHAKIELDSVNSGDLVTICMNYYPKWRIYFQKNQISTFNFNSKLAFRAPQNGSYTLSMEY